MSGDDDGEKKRTKKILTRERFNERGKRCEARACAVIVVAIFYYRVYESAKERTRFIHA